MNGELLLGVPSHQIHEPVTDGWINNVSTINATLPPQKFNTTSHIMKFYGGFLLYLLISWAAWSAMSRAWKYCTSATSATSATSKKLEKKIAKKQQQTKPTSKEEEKKSKSAETTSKKDDASILKFEAIYFSELCDWLDTWIFQKEAELSKKLSDKFHNSCNWLETKLREQRLKHENNNPEKKLNHELRKTIEELQFMIEDRSAAIFDMEKQAEESNLKTCLDELAKRKPKRPENKPESKDVLPWILRKFEDEAKPEIEVEIPELVPLPGDDEEIITEEETEEGKQKEVQEETQEGTKRILEESDQSQQAWEENLRDADWVEVPHEA